VVICLISVRSVLGLGLGFVGFGVKILGVGLKILRMWGYEEG